MQLRGKQQKTIDSARAALRTNRNVLIQAPTGFGKTVLASFMAKAVAKKGNRLYFICHRQELLTQTAKTFSKNGLPFSFIANGLSYDPTCMIQICSIDTLKNRYERLPKPDVSLWDEAHHLGAAGWSKVHSYYDKTYHIGLSATPQRLDGKGLGDWFDYMVAETSVRELIDDGFLSDYKIYAPSKPDLNQVHVRMGDYSKTEVAAVMDKAHLTGDIVNHWLKLAPRKKTVVFAINIEHSRHIIESFKSRGIPAAHLDGGTPRAERKQTCLDFAEGKIDVISNVGLFGEGFDLAAQTDIDVTVECVISARPTMSLSLWLQMCGRALRMKDSPAIIIDHAGNVMKHGLPCSEREWSLEGNPNQGKKKDDDEVKIKECPSCYHVHLPAPICPECGHVYEVNNREIVEVDGNLEEINKEAMRIQARQEQGQTGDLGSLITLGKKRGYKNPAKWAAKVWTSREAKKRAAAERAQLKARQQMEAYLTN